MELKNKVVEIKRIIKEVTDFLICDEWFEVEKEIDYIQKCFGEIAIIIASKPVETEENIIVNNMIIQLLNSIVNAKALKDSMQMADLLQCDLVELLDLIYNSGEENG